MKAQQVNEMAAERLSAMTTEQLVEQWNLVSQMAITKEVAKVRNWILAALEKKEPQKMERYFSDFFASDEDLQYFLLD